MLKPTQCFFKFSLSNLRVSAAADLHSSSSSSRWRCGPCLASPAGPRRAGSPAPSGSRRGTPGCRSCRGRGHRPSTPRTRHTSRRSAAEVVRSCHEDYKHTLKLWMKDDQCGGTSAVYVLMVWHLQMDNQDSAASDWCLCLTSSLSVFSIYSQETFGCLPADWYTT